MMLYTNVEKVKQHLISEFPTNSRVFDQPAVLTGVDFVTFFGGPVEEASVGVKSIQSNELKKVTVTLGVVSTILPDDLLIRGTVVVASDSSLGTVYIENKDFIVDCSKGVLTIKSGGALNSGQEVIVWYGFYFSYQVSSDYVLNALDGSIRRVTSGNIASSETILLDYSPILQSYNDAIIQNAVDEANALIEKTIDPGQQFGVDPVLQAASTYRAVEIVCRASAARELSRIRGEYNVALTWLKLAQDYARRSDELIQSFRAPFSGPSAPTST